MKIIVWNSQDKCVADYHKLIRGCDVLCLLDCGQWTVPMYDFRYRMVCFTGKMSMKAFPMIYFIAWRRWRLYVGMVCTAENLFYIAFIPI